MNRETAQRLALCLALALLTLTVFSEVRGHSFVFDDGNYILDNSHIREGLTFQSLRWAFTSTYAAFWHPLTWISHLLDVSLFGMDPAGHHLSALLLHVVNALLLFLVLEGMTGGRWQSAFVAALFAIHPLHVESVAMVAQRKDLLSTFFWFLTMGAYLRYVKKPSLRRYIPVALSFLLGLMAKPMLVTLPLVLLLLDLWPLSRFRPLSPVKIGRFHLELPGRRLWLEKLPLLAVVPAISIISYNAQQAAGAVGAGVHYPLWVRASNATLSYSSYLGKTIWPARLAVFYPHPGFGVSVTAAVLSAAFLALVTILVLRHLRTHPFLAVGWFWFLGTMVPVIGIVQLGAMGMADRFTYVPLVGIFVLVAWGTTELARQWRLGTSVLAAFSLLAVCGFGYLARQQVSFWKSDLTLYSHAVEVTRDNWLAEHGLGNALQREGRYEEETEHYRRALAIVPNYFDAQYSLGVNLLRRGEIDEALEHLDKALQVYPEHRRRRARNEGLHTLRPGTGRRGASPPRMRTRRHTTATGESNSP